MLQCTVNFQPVHVLIFIQNCLKGCTKRFPRSYELVRHAKIHDGVKPFPCDWPGCDKEFARSADLKRHIKSHTIDAAHVIRNHACAHCDKKFARAYELTRHAKVLKVFHNVYIIKGG